LDWNSVEAWQKGGSMNLASGLSKSLRNRMNLWPIRLIGSGVLVAFFYEQFYSEDHWILELALAVVLYYLLMIWNSRILRSLPALVASAAIICTMAIYVHVTMDVDTSLLILPMVALLASLPQSQTLQSVVLAAACSVVTIIASYGVGFPWGTLFGLAGIYAFVRGRNEGEQLREQHLEELNAAHGELQRAHSELERSSVESVRYAALSERSRIAREVHDVVGHNLTTLIVQLQALQYMLPGDPHAAAAEVPRMLHIARSGLNEVRKTVGEMADDEFGLGAAALRGLVSQVVAQSHLQIHFLADDKESDWPISISVVLYRILQECLTNVLRYAEAGNVWVNVTERGEAITLGVSDDGIYRGDPPLQPGFGFRGMSERAASVGGKCEWGVRAPHGLTVSVMVPLTDELGREGNPRSGWR
jgi:signal transduction histidine kinase